MRDFKRNVKGLILESNTSIDLVQDNDNGAIYHYQNKINAFLNNTVKEIVSIVRDTNANLLTNISQGKIVNGDMVFNTTENTYQQVIAGQLVSFGSGGGSDPALEGRVDALETSVQNIVINQEEMDDNLAIARAELYDLINLTGVAENSSNLGPFTGSYLNDSTTIKGALQALETAVELGLESTAGDLSSLIAQVDQLENDLNTESTNRINGDATTLAAANAYTDAEIAAIPGVDLTTIQNDITTLQGNVSSLQGNVSSLQSADTGLQTQINTINNNTIPASIASANSYTDTQISSLPQVFSKSEVYEMLGILYYEGFEGAVQGSLSNGASVIDIGANPLEVLSGSKSLYLPHNNSIESFVSSNINVPNISKVMGSCYISFQYDTTVSDGSTPSALLRVYDVTNSQYLQLGLSGSPTSFGFISTYTRSPKFDILVLPTTEVIRVEIISNTSNPGYTVVDQLKITTSFNF